MKSLYPLKFDPIFQYRIWGGRNLENLISKPLPEKELIGEAWILSDRKDFSNKILEGKLKGQTLTEVLKSHQSEIMGKFADQFDSFPLLLKFLDCHELLSVQVHPSDDQKDFIPEGDTGKTEAWIVLDTFENSQIFAGLKKGTTKEKLAQSIQENKVSDYLHSFIPKIGDALYIPSGSVHTLGGALVFEVQENSDVTFRLYDWDRNDAKTGKPRELQVEKALETIDFTQTELSPVQPIPDAKDTEILFDNSHFKVWRIQTKSQQKVGFENQPTILVCLDGKGEIEFKSEKFGLKKGEVMLLPAELGKLKFNSFNECTYLQIAISSK